MKTMARRYPKTEIDEIGKLPRADMQDIPPLELKCVWSQEQFLEICDYRVIVEMFERSTHGRGKRLYEATFNEDERRIIHAHHKKFRQWHLQCGTPGRIAMDPDVLDVLQRAANFFGTL